MWFIAGISAKIKELPSTKPRRCPVCEEIVRLHVTHRYITPHVFYIPTVKLRSAYQAICPRCAAIMTLHPERGRILERNPRVPIPDRDLKPQGKYRLSIHTRRF